MTLHPNQSFEPSTRVLLDPKEKRYRSSGFHFCGLNPTTQIHDLRQAFKVFSGDPWSQGAIFHQFFIMFP